MLKSLRSQWSQIKTSVFLNKGENSALYAQMCLKHFLYPAAERHFLEAIELYDRVLTLAPDNVQAQSFRAAALLGMGEAQAGQSQFEAAAANYRAAFDLFEDVLRSNPENYRAAMGQGITVLRLGQTQAATSQQKQAYEDFREAVERFEKASQLKSKSSDADGGRNLVFDLNPNLSNANTGKGLAYLELGRLYSAQSQYGDAEGCFREAVEALNEIAQTQGETIAYKNQGAALLELGRSQGEQSKYEDAATSFRAAIDAYDAALKLDPKAGVVQKGKGLALHCLGLVYRALNRGEEAETVFREATRFDPSLPEAK